MKTLTLPHAWCAEGVNETTSEFLGCLFFNIVRLVVSPQIPVCVLSWPRPVPLLNHLLTYFCIPLLLHRFVSVPFLPLSWCKSFCLSLIYTFLGPFFHLLSVFLCILCWYATSLFLVSIQSSVWIIPIEIIDFLFFFCLLDCSVNNGWLHHQGLPDPRGWVTAVTNKHTHTHTYLRFPAGWGYVFPQDADGGDEERTWHHVHHVEKIQSEMLRGK